MRKIFIFSCILFTAFLIGCEITEPEAQKQIGSGTISIPASGSSYNSSDSINISWDTTGTSASASINIKLYNESKYILTIKSPTTNDGLYQWYVPEAVTSSNYQIVIERYNFITKITDLDTSGNFTISGQTIENVLSFTNPISGSIYDASTSYTIEWNADATIFGSSIYLYLCQGSSSVLYSSSSTSNDGSYSLSIPSGVETGDDYKIMIKSTSNSAVFGYSNVFSISGKSNDKFEDDDSKATANLLLPDSTQSHTILYKDYDWVKIPVVKGNQYTISTNSSIANIMKLYATTASGKDTIITDYSNYTTNNCEISYYPEISDTIYVCIEDYDAYTGNYTISVKCYEPTSNAIFKNPSSGTNFETDSTYALEWNVDTSTFGSDIRLYLYKGYTLIESISYATDNDGNYSWLISTGLETSSDYRIKMEKSTNYNTFGYSDIFTIKGVSVDSFEEDDDISIAHLFKVADATSESHTLPYNDIDWFKFSATKDVYYKIYASTSDSYLSLTLYDIDGYTSLEKDVSDEIYWMCPKSETYYISANNLSSASKGISYSLAIYDYTTSEYKYTITSPILTSDVNTAEYFSIRWNSNINKNGKIDIFLYRNNELKSTIVSDITDVGYYSWYVSSNLTTGTGYYIKVRNRKNQTINGQSSTFTISSK